MSEIGDLIEAADLSPGKGALLRAVLRAAEDAVEPGEALDWLGRTDPRAYDAKSRLAAAEYLLASGEPSAALTWTSGEDGPELAMKARALLALDRSKEAAECYALALEKGASLVDSDLEEKLKARRAPLAHAPAGNVVSLHGGQPIQTAALAPVARETKTFSDVGGLEEVKRDIARKIILPFKKPSLFGKFRRKAGGGVLLFGPPGCGKTMMARATAGEVGAGFISIEISEILDMYIGQSEKRLASAFANARASTPTVLFFDEIEALASRRRFGSSDHGASLVSTFLNELDGVGADNEGVLVLAATNVPWAIDTAFRRPGRFDRVLFIPPPDREARLAILKLALKDRPQEDVSLEPIANATSGFSGADLVGLIEAACDLAIEESLDGGKVTPIRQKHLSEAAKAMKPTTLEWLSQARNYAKYANEGGLYDDVAAFLDKHAR